MRRHYYFDIHDACRDATSSFLHVVVDVLLMISFIACYAFMLCFHAMLACLLSFYACMRRPPRKSNPTVVVANVTLNGHVQTHEYK